MRAAGNPAPGAQKVPALVADNLDVEDVPENGLNRRQPVQRLGTNLLLVLAAQRGRRLREPGVQRHLVRDE